MLITRAGSTSHRAPFTGRAAAARLSIVLATLGLLFPGPGSAAAPRAEDRERGEEALRALLPGGGGASGLEASTGPRFFGPDTLWKHINGEAGFYLQYGFRLLAVSEYAAAAGAVPLAVEIYEMESPLHAFGIYAAERSPDEDRVDAGVQGYRGTGLVNFWAGPYYVKLSSRRAPAEAGETLLNLAREIAGRIPGRHAEPDLLTCLPEEGRIGTSERFLPRDVLGLGFLRNGYRANYEGDGGSYQVLLVENGSAEEALENYGKYRDFLRSRGSEITHEMEGASRRFRAADGSGQVVFLSGTILGAILGAPDLSRAEAIADGIAGRLKARGDSSRCAE